MTTSTPSSRPSSRALRENLHDTTAPDELGGSATPGSLSQTLVSESTPLLRPKPAVTRDTRAHTFSEVKEEAWFMLRLAAPVFGTQVLEYSLMIVSVVTIGHISTDALAASSLASMTASVSGLSVINGFVCALDSLLPQAWASDRPQHVGLWTQRMVVLMSMILIPVIVIWLNAEWILLRLKQEPAIAHLAGIYLRWFCLSLPGQAISVISRRYYQAQGLMHVPTMIMLTIAPLNASLSWLLVWGPKPLNLGFIGAPIASSISFNLMALLSIAYGRFFVVNTAWHPINSLCLHELGKLFWLGLSGLGQIATEWWSWEIIVFAASQLGSIKLAAQSVLVVSSTVAYETPYSLGLATSVRVGNLLGAGQGQRAKLAAETAIGMSLITALIMSSIFLTFRNTWGLLFNDDEEVVKIVASVLPLVALFQIFDGATTVSNGVLRALGMLGLGAIVNLCSYYVIGIPFGIWLAFWGGLGLRGLWIGLAVALFCAANITVYVIFRTDWDREVVRTRERLGQEEREREEVPRAAMV